MFVSLYEKGPLIFKISSFKVYINSCVRIKAESEVELKLLCYNSVEKSSDTEAAGGHGGPQDCHGESRERGFPRLLRILLRFMALTFSLSWELTFHIASCDIRSSERKAQRYFEMGQSPISWDPLFLSWNIEIRPGATRAWISLLRICNAIISSSI